MPFAPEMIWLYDTPCCPTGNDVGLMVGAKLIVIVRSSEPEVTTPVACTLKVDPPFARGTPVRFTLLPVVESRERPAGGAPIIDHVQNIQGSPTSVAVKFRE